MQKAPTGLGTVGKRLWREICADLDEDGLVLTARERQWLHSACALRDRVDQLEKILADADPMTLGSAGQIVTHPAVIEVRNSHAAIAQLLSRLSFDDGGASDGPSFGITVSPGARSVNARKAAQKRWGG